MSIILAAAYMPLHGMFDLVFKRVGNASQPSHEIERFVPKEGEPGKYEGPVEFCEFDVMRPMILKVQEGDVVKISTHVPIFDFYAGETHCWRASKYIRIEPKVRDCVVLLSEDSITIASHEYILRLKQRFQ